MLLLIAVANVVWWFPSTTIQWTVVDQLWVVARTMLVDQRAYPLFALLLGFGMTVLSRRRYDRERARGIPSSDAQAHSRRALRRRGLWLAIFGALHAVVFSGDILGAYGVAMMLFAGVVALGRRTVLMWVGLASAVFSVAMLSLNAVVAGLRSPEAGEESPVHLGLVSQLAMDVAYWMVNIPVTLMSSLVVAMLCWGAAVGHTTVLTQPAVHRSTYWRCVWLGVVGVLLGLPYGLYAAGFWQVTVETAAWLFLVQTVSGAMVALGWCGVIALCIARRGSSVQRPWTQAVEQLGQRSLSGYLGQTVVFWATMMLTTTLWPQWTPTVVVAGGIALMTWLVTVIAAKASAGTIVDRPAERALRRLVG